MISKDLTSRIVNQHRQHQSNEDVNQNQEQSKAYETSTSSRINKRTTSEIFHQKRLNEVNQKQEASSWLTTLAILVEGYDLTKQFFGTSCG